MQDQLAELSADLRDRAMTYSFLARIFSDQEVGVDFLAMLSADAPQTATELDAFAAGLHDADLETARVELAAEHSRLLLNMMRVPVSPFESVWTSEMHLMMQESRDDVVARYARAGFAKVEEYHMPEDHISLELDFCAALLTRAADGVDEVLAGAADGTQLASAEADMNAQFDFLNTHLLNWVPAYCDEFESKATTPFYRGAAQMLRGFISGEKEYLDSLSQAGE